VSLTVGNAPTPTPTASVRNAIANVNGSPASPSSTNATVPAGSAVAFQVNATIPLPSGLGSPYGTPYTYPTTITNFLSPNYTVNLSDVSGASGLIVATPANRPAGVAADATTVQCTPTLTSTGTATIGLLAHLKSTATTGADPMANVACLSGTSYGSPYGTPYGGGS
jgi:hypothetical protein